MESAAALSGQRRQSCLAAAGEGGTPSRQPARRRRYGTRLEWFFPNLSSGALSVLDPHFTAAVEIHEEKL
jgi:hypothetical protein